MHLLRVVSVVFLFAQISLAQPEQTVGLFLHTAGSLDNGYVLFAPISYTTTYLMDKCGKLVHTWPSKYLPHETAYFLKDGTLMRVGSYATPSLVGGIIEKINWDGAVLWSYAVADSSASQHHDIQPLPNGNVLVIANEFHMQADAYNSGRDTTDYKGTLLSEVVLELQPVGTDSAIVVWKWRAWDHLVQAINPSVANYHPISEHPELIDINYITSNSSDWLHINSVKYNAALNQIILSSHQFCEFWIIDHSTTTAEAASHQGGKSGHGGDLLYRWGNPLTYAHGTAADQKLFSQHDPEWIPAGCPDSGKIILLNNGVGRPGGTYTSVDIISPPVDSAGHYDSSTLPYLPAKQDWIYTATPPASFITPGIGGTQMLVNGNRLVCAGTSGKLFEIDSLGTRVWDYTNPVIDTGPVAQGTAAAGNALFRCKFFAATYPGFAGHTLAAGDPIETSPLPYDCQLNTDAVNESAHDAVVDPTDENIFVYPNPARDNISVADARGDARVKLFDCLGEQVLQGSAGHALNTAELRNGVYLLVITDHGKSTSRNVSIFK